MKKLVKADYLSRVEGEGGITVEIIDGHIEKLHVKIFEAPRFFESFLRGRPYNDVIDFTARICGICPVAYQMSSVHAIETIFGIDVEEPIRKLRRLLYCGEWLESHALHIYLLQGPDFYGAESAWSKKDYLPIAREGLFFKKLGNRILTLLGGRPIHPVSVKVGGFSKLPEKKSLLAILPDLEDAFDLSVREIERVAGLPFPENDRETEYVSLSDPHEYPMIYGRVISNRGLDMPMAGFPEEIREHQVEHSTALHSELKRDGSASPYVVGPLARLNLNHDKLPHELQEIMIKCGIKFPVLNSHMGIIARSVELAYAFHDAIRIIKAYEKPDRASIGFEPKAGEAAWITEAPRGMLIHRYELDDDGFVKSCTLIPPTSQNLGSMERDLRDFIQSHIDEPADFLRKEGEKIIRSYDPCISCSVHVVLFEKTGKRPVCRGQM
jgi:sulfhydrogenase subunit alpha